jgi:endonuclease YncB( thermonuclease family)
VDEYNRYLAEVYLPLKDGEKIAVNQEMVKAGYAHYYSYFGGDCPGNANTYQQLEKLAMLNKDGIWRQKSVERPWDWRQRNKGE